MRYIIHLLPHERQRRAFDDLRARMAAEIGPNRALGYPTAHVTLVWSIQDSPNDDAPIDREALAALLDAYAGNGPLPLTPRAGDWVEEHVLLPLDDTPELAALRSDLYHAARSVVADPAGQHAERAGRVREQTWPHLTLAQDVEADRWERGIALLHREGDWVFEPLIGAELALLGRDVEADQPYRIVHRVPLLPRAPALHATTPCLLQRPPVAQPAPDGWGRTSTGDASGRRGGGR